MTNATATPAALAVVGFWRRRAADRAPTPRCWTTREVGIGYGAKFYNVVGRLKNASDHPLAYVKLRIDAVDKDGKVVASTETYNESAEVLGVPEVDGQALLAQGKIKQIAPGAEERFRGSFLEEETPPFDTYRHRRDGDRRLTRRSRRPRLFRAAAACRASALGPSSGAQPRRDVPRLLVGERELVAETERRALAARGGVELDLRHRGPHRRGEGHLPVHVARSSPPAARRCGPRHASRQLEVDPARAAGHQDGLEVAQVDGAAGVANDQLAGHLDLLLELARHRHGGRERRLRASASS